MRVLRFLTVPTLLGWLVAYVTCMVLHFIGNVSLFGFPPGKSLESFVRGYATALIFGGAFIVIPTYVLVILPLSIIDLRGSRRDRPKSASVYFGAILASGVAVTVAFASMRLTNLGWASSKTGQVLLFYLPFLPYAAVVALTAKRLIPVSRMKTEPNQSSEPTPTSGTSAAEQPRVPAAVVAHL